MRGVQSVLWLLGPTFSRKDRRVGLLTTSGLRPALHGTIICRWAKQIWFILQSEVKPLKGSCYITSADGWARSQEKEKIKGPWSEAAFTQAFLKHMPFPYKMKRGVFCMGFSHSPIILVSSSQFSILCFICSGIDEPFPQHFPALTGLCRTLSSVNCALSSVWTLVSTKGWLDHLWHPHAFSQALCYWVSLALCACHHKWHLLPYGNSPWIQLKHGLCVWFGSAATTVSGKKKVFYIYELGLMSLLVSSNCFIGSYLYC